MKDKLIEALKNQKKWYKQNGGGWPDDDHAIIYLAAKSTLTPPDTQGAVDALANCEVISRGGKYLLLSYDSAQKIERALTRPSREVKLLEALKRIEPWLPTTINRHAENSLAAQFVRQVIAEAEGE